MAIAIPIKPQHLWNIMNGIKKGEVRKNEALINAIKKEIAEKGKATIYCICSKSKPYIKQCEHFRVLDYTEIANEGYYLNGKVVCKFECKKVEDIKYTPYECTYYTETLDTILIGDKEPTLLKSSCLDYQELADYLGREKEVVGAFIYISNLKIFDKAKDISDLRFARAYNFGDMHNCRVSLTKAPQNFCYVEDTL